MKNEIEWTAIRDESQAQAQQELVNKKKSSAFIPIGWPKGLFIPNPLNILSTSTKFFAFAFQEIAKVKLAKVSQ